MSIRIKKVAARAGINAEYRFFGKGVIVRKGERNKPLATQHKASAEVRQ